MLQLKLNKPRFGIKKFFLYLTGLNLLLVACNIFLLHPPGDLNAKGSNNIHCSPHPPFLSKASLTSSSRRRFEDDASLPTPISMFQQQPDKNASACNNLDLDLQGIRILLLDVHFEGNLGDEMETTPLLQHLFDCGAHITAALSEWRPATSTQKVHPRTAREHMLVHKIISREKYYSTIHNDNHNDFDAVILAPGPWKPCLQKSQWPHLMIDIYFGGSFVADPSCASNNNGSNNNEPLLPPDLLERTQLIVTREPASYEWIQQHIHATSSKSKNTPNLIMGADLSYSYRPSRAAIDYWSDYYRSYQDENYSYTNQILVFSRSNNFNTGVRILGGGGGNPKAMLKVGNGSKVIVPLSQVVFASSSDIEDTQHFEFLQSNYHLRLGLEKQQQQQQQVVMCTSVEQLWGLLLALGPQGHVYTDRYHPGVAAHILGVPFTTLSYPDEQIKLKGLAALTAAKTPRELKQLNDEAFAALDHYLAATLQARKKDGNKNRHG
jgi:hypothetical protein